MMYGIDISHWNDRKKIDDLIRTEQIVKPEFVIIKGSEGKTGQDKERLRNLEWAMSRCHHIGYYHYVRPENNKEKSEYDNIVRTFDEMKSFGVDKKLLLCLDIEDKALMPAYKPWMYNLAAMLIERYKKPPMIYMQASSVPKYYTGNLDRINCGLWVARYDNDVKMAQTRAKYGISGLVAMKQYYSKPIDLDIFYGDGAAWERYCI